MRFTINVNEPLNEGHLCSKSQCVHLWRFHDDLLPTLVGVDSQRIVMKRRNRRYPQERKTVMKTHGNTTRTVIQKSIVSLRDHSTRSDIGLLYSGAGYAPFFIQ